MHLTRELKIGKFKVVRRLGRGGMGAVYEAFDTSLHRRVAIKTLLAQELAGEDSRRRFEREARAAARLQHQNIVTIHELGNFDSEEKPYIVMEYLKGSDLSSVIREDESIPLAESLDVVSQLCRALDYAHQHEVIHRDVKPSNVRYLDDGLVKIMDFGIARMAGTPQITQSGVLMGTMHYMSPEQVQGQPLDGRSDVFSAGCILYEMLARRVPFGGDAASAVLYKIVWEEPPPILDSHPELPEQVQDILGRALAKKTSDRFASAGEMKSGARHRPRNCAQELSAADARVSERACESRGAEAKGRVEPSPSARRKIVGGPTRFGSSGAHPTRGSPRAGPDGDRPAAHS